MRWLLGLLCVAACGDNPQVGPIDSPPPPPIDGPEIDAAVDAAIDAPEIDAPEIDAPAIDAPVDAPGIDAPPANTFCNDNSQCTADHYCEFSGIGYCVPDGWCLPRPTACPSPQPGDRLFCGCDNQRYPSACDANAAGVSIGPGACPSVGDLYPCGYTYCQRHTEYCREDREDNNFPNRYFSCHPMPTQPACPTLLAQPCPGDFFPAYETCTENVSAGTAHYMCFNHQF